MGHPSPRLCEVAGTSPWISVLKPSASDKPPPGSLAPAPLQWEGGFSRSLLAPHRCFPSLPHSHLSFLLQGRGNRGVLLLNLSLLAAMASGKLCGCGVLQEGFLAKREGERCTLCKTKPGRAAQTCPMVRRPPGRWPAGTARSLPAGEGATDRVGASAPSEEMGKLTSSARVWPRDHGHSRARPLSCPTAPCYGVGAAHLPQPCPAAPVSPAECSDPPPRPQ